ncbi:MAG TPA: group II intron maturase-specific domain-containing protein, partial [Herpetosiphonaceae bacterium]|nr:group II intron maturase-specific domain-containing protein [Herpetosiphonaceae bacterium]
ANVYMHQLDEWAAAHSHRLTQYQRARRRQQGLATIRLTRYADDFVIAVKGTREQAEAIRADVAAFLKTALRMDLSLEKTHITHRSEGFTFLGIDVRYAPSKHLKDTAGQGKAYVYFRPSRKAIERYKEQIRALTSPGATHRNDVEVIRAINRFVRSWGAYYRHANSSQVFTALDYWTWKRVFRWLQHRYRLQPRATYKRFCVNAAIPLNRHPTRNDKRLGVWDRQGQHLALDKLSFIPIRYWNYRGTTIPQLYAGGESTRIHPDLPDYDVVVWSERQNPHYTAEYRNAREATRIRAKFRCEQCATYIAKGGHLHHKDGDPTNCDPENLELLCRKCHIATDSYGRHTTPSRSPGASIGR